MTKMRASAKFRAHPKRSAPGSDWLLKSALPMLLILFTVLAYSNSLNGVFLLDDSQRILDNPAVRLPGPIWDHIRGLFVFARPLSDLSLRLNFQLGGVDTFGYHVFNIAVHVISALILMGFARVCFSLSGAGDSRARVFAFDVALLWALHPLQTQAVTYIYQRAESMGGLFFLLTMYCAARGLSTMRDNSRRSVWLAASIVACVTGHLCKQTLFTAPFAVLAFEYCLIGGRFPEILRRSWRYYLCITLTWLVGVGLIVATRMDDSVGYSIRNVTLFGYALSQPGVILHYLRLALWPDFLLIDYAWPLAKTLEAILIPLALIVALVAAVVYALRRPERSWRAVGFIGTWFFLTLAITSSFFPIKDLAFEHRMYLPLASVSALYVVAARHALRGTKTQTALVLAAALALGVRTYSRNADYSSPQAIWSSVLARAPENPRAMNELGNAYRDAGRPADALALYEKAIATEPDNPGPHLNAGSMYMRLGRTIEAERHFRQAIQKRPWFPDAHLDLGNALAVQGKKEEAAAEYTIAISQKPDFFEALMARANTLCLLDRFDEALQSYRLAILIRPESFEGYSDLGTAFFRIGRYEEALRYYYEALRRQPDSAAVHMSAANTLRKLGRDQEAADHETAAKRLTPIPQTGSKYFVTPTFGAR